MNQTENIIRTKKEKNVLKIYLMNECCCCIILSYNPSILPIGYHHHHYQDLIFRFVVVEFNSDKLPKPDINEVKKNYMNEDDHHHQHIR